MPEGSTTKKAAAPPKTPSMQGLKKELEADREARQELEAKVDGIDRSLASLDGKLDNLLNAMTERQSSRAIDQPTSFRHYDESEDHYQGGGGHAELVDGPDGHPMIERPRVMDVDSPEFRDKASRMAFEAQILRIRISDRMNDDEDANFVIKVNGREWKFFRGQEYPVPRYVVYGLCQARPMSYGNEEYIKPNGARAIRNPSSRGVRYAFQVLEDPDPRGPAWLQAALAAK